MLSLMVVVQNRGSKFQERFSRFSLSSVADVAVSNVFHASDVSIYNVKFTLVLYKILFFSYLFID